MILTFSKRLRTNNYEPLMADSVSIERVTDFKILGVIISADLSWSKHVRYIVSKARMHVRNLSTRSLWFCF